jgi:hypothetical protein
MKMRNGRLIEGRGGKRQRLAGVLGYLVVMSVLFARVAGAEPRTFKNAAGAEIKAEILYGTADMVTIKMANGKELTTPIVKFSEEDQKFIHEWIKTQPPKINYNFGFKYEKTRKGKKERQTSSHEVAEESWAYDLTLENRSRAKMEGLEMRYRIYVSSEHTKKKNTKVILISDGMLKVPALDKGASKEMQTKTVQVLTSNLKDGYVYNDGGRHRLSDDLAGIWVKVFHKGQRIWEFESPQKALKDYPFTDSEAVSIGKKGAKDDD